MALRRLDLGPGVAAALTDRRGGLSRPPYDECNLATHVGDDSAAVAGNRAKVADLLDLEATAVVWMDQVHGARVRVVAAGPGQVPGPGTDAIVTTAPGVALAVLVADCVPVLLADPAAGVVAVAHAGRRGVQLGLVPAVLAAMVELGAQLQDVRAVLGPAVCGGCYEVPQQLQDDVAAVVPSTRASTPSGTPSLDLRAGLGELLRQAGVGSVEVDRRCTVEDGALYSYRRDGTTGRFGGYLWLTG